MSKEVKLISHEFGFSQQVVIKGIYDDEVLINRCGNSKAEKIDALFNNLGLCKFSSELSEEHVSILKDYDSKITQLRNDRDKFVSSLLLNKAKFVSLFEEDK